jgi:TRAP-type C4-dicarboxylate transport system substrate-binding protein
MVKNKRILQLGMVTLLLAVLSPVSAKTIKIATVSPDGTLWMKEMRAGAAEIKEKTQGRVVLKFYPGGVMGNDSNVLRKIRVGQLHGGAVTSGSLSGIDPNIDIYGLPYLFSSLEQVDYVREKMDETLIKSLEDKGFVSFGFGEGGFTYMMSDSPLHTVQDVRQQKVWVPADNRVGEAVFNSAEISPVTLPLSDVLTGLQTGLVDTVITSPIGAIALQWHTRVKYLIDVPLTYITATLVIQKSTLNKLKKEDQQIVRDVMSAAFKRIDASNRKDNIAAREALRNQGIEFISLSKESLAAWHVIGEKAMRLLEEENKYSGPVFRQIKDNIEAARKAHP